MTVTQTKTAEKKLIDILSQAMRVFGRNCPQDSEVKSFPGYFFLPISVQGRPYNLPLGFLGTVGCSRAKQGGCTMCNYGGFANNPCDQELINQAECLLKCWEKEGPLREIHLSALGSFFDDAEVSPRAREGVLECVASRKSIDLLAVESRPEFITPAKIWEARKILGLRVRFEVGVGLESSNEFIRNICVKKGLTKDDYLKTVDCLKNLDAGVTTHILFKPPFLTEAEAIEDTISSVNYAEEKGADRIVLMVSNIKDYTLTSWLLEKGLYRVPWLWGVLKTALEISKKAQRKLLIYGFKCGIPLMDRGRNCPRCTDTILNKIDLFNFTGNIKHLEEGFLHHCECKGRWLEGFDHTDGFTSLSVPERVEKVCELLKKDVLKYGKALEN